MSIRTLALPSLLVAFGLSLAACYGKESDDTSTDTDTDTDTDDTDDTDTDTDDTDDDEDDYFEPDVMYFEYTAGIVDGSTATMGYDYDGGTGSLPPYFIIYMVDYEEWEGTTDTDNACIVYFSASDEFGSLDSTFNDAGAWQGWMMNDMESALLGYDGVCDDIDPDLWGMDAVEFILQYDWGLGVGVIGEDLDEAIASSWEADEYEEYGPKLISNYTYTTMFDNAGDTYAFTYGFVWETDDDNMLVLDDEGAGTYIDVADSAYAPNGYYTTSPAFGFYLSYAVEPSDDTGYRGANSGSSDQGWRFNLDNLPKISLGL